MHCSYFWDHALSKDQVERSLKTKNLLDSAVAVPIWLRKSPEDYKSLAKKLLVKMKNLFKKYMLLIIAR